MGLFEQFGFSAQTHFRIEGRHGLNTALDSSWPIELILHHGEPEDHWPQELCRACRRDELSARLGFQFHRGVIAIAKRPADPCLPDPLPELMLGLCGIADPGNLGTLIRNAAAFGAGLVLCDPACTDPFNPKAIRASATGIFQVPLVTDFDFSAAGSIGQAVWLASSSHGSSTPADQFQPISGNPRLLLLGNEGEGLPDSLIARADHLLRIPHSDAIESLNVASASAILLHRLSSGM